MMHTLPFDSINKNAVDELVSLKTAESKFLDYKQSIHSNKDSDIKEFLADVSSFANTAGGIIVFGVSDERTKSGGKTGKPGSITGIENTASDGIILRLEAQIRDGISPKLNVQAKAVPTSDNSCVIVLKIPQSYSAPHMVTFQKTAKFFARNSAGKYQLEVQEIRHAFIESESLPERIRNFRADRLSKIEADETPVPIKRLPRFVAHLVPLNAFLHSHSIAKIEFNRETRSQIQNLGEYFGLTHNFDGMYSSDGLDDGQCHAYCQFFRNGVIEIVKVISATHNPSPSLIIPSISYERDLINEFRKHLNLCNSLGIALPIFLMISLLNVKGVRIGVDSRLEFNLGITARPIDRQSLLIPEIYIDNYDIDTGLLLKPFFDSVWQACGFEGSQNYDASGSWNK